MLTITSPIDPTDHKSHAPESDLVVSDSEEMPWSRQVFCDSSLRPLHVNFVSYYRQIQISNPI